MDMGHARFVANDSDAATGMFSGDGLHDTGRLRATRESLDILALSRDPYAPRLPGQPMSRKLALAMPNSGPHATLFASQLTAPFACFLYTHK
jgi:hypothetical protein